MQTRRNARPRSTPIAAIDLALAVAVASFAIGERDARAQSAQAEALFQEGNRLMDQSKFAQACDAFAASNRLEPGAGVLLNLGDCRAKNGQLASAWAAYKAALSRAKTPKKRTDAKDKIAAIESRLSYLTVTISNDSRVEGLSLTSNGDPLEPAQWNQVLPVDGGDYAIAGSAPGRESWQVVAHVPAEGGNVTIQVPKLEPRSQPVASATVPPPPLAPPGATASTTEPASRADAQSTGTFITRRKVAIGVAGASAIGIGVGVALGVSAKRKESDAFDRCPDPNTPCLQASEAQSLLASGHRRAIEANIALGIGAAAAIGAGVLWFTGAPDVESPRRVSVVPSVAPGETGIVVMGRF